MKSRFPSLLVLGAVVVAGCTNGVPGGPGAPDGTANKPIVGLAEDTFSLSVPTLSTSLKQGEAKTASIGLKRGKNFDQEVALKFADVPKGVTIDPASPVIKHGDTEAKFTIKAADDAAIGDFNIKVTGHPTKGADASNDFKLTVNKK